MRNVRGRTAWIVGILVAVLVSASITGWIYFHKGTSSFAPQPVVTASKQVAFPVYYPTQLPAGFQFQPSSLSTTSQVVIFNFTSGKRTISVTEQPASINFDFSQSGGDAHTVAGLGTVTFLSNHEFNGAGIQTAHTSLFLSNPNDVDSGSFAQFAQSFQQIK